MGSYTKHGFYHGFPHYIGDGVPYEFRVEIDHIYEPDMDIDLWDLNWVLLAINGTELVVLSQYDFVKMYDVSSLKTSTLSISITISECQSTETNMPTSPTKRPSIEPSEIPSNYPSSNPTTDKPSDAPTDRATYLPSMSPSIHPTLKPTVPTSPPTFIPSESPTNPTQSPSRTPSSPPTANPSVHPTVPTLTPSMNPTVEPTEHILRPTRYPVVAYETESKILNDDIIIALIVVFVIFLCGGVAVGIYKKTSSISRRNKFGSMNQNYVQLDDNAL